MPQEASMWESNCIRCANIIEGMLVRAMVAVAVAVVVPIVGRVHVVVVVLAPGKLASCHLGEEEVDPVGQGAVLQMTTMVST